MSVTLSGRYSASVPDLTLVVSNLAFSCYLHY